jgi:hypothetical protein
MIYMYSWVEGLRFRAIGSGSGVQGYGSRDQALEFKVCDLWPRGWGLGFRLLQISGLRVQGVEFRI